MAARIDKLCDEKGLTQAQLYPVLYPGGKAEDPKDRARCVRRKLDPRKIEKLSAGDLCALADLFGVDVDFLLCRMDESTHKNAFICEQTGLCESLVKFLKRRKSSAAVYDYRKINGDLSAETWQHGYKGLDRINAIFDRRQADKLLNSINDFFGLSFRSAAAAKNLSALPGPGSENRSPQVLAVGVELQQEQDTYKALAYKAETETLNTFREMLETAEKKARA